MKNNRIEFSTGILIIENNLLSFCKKKTNKSSTILRENIGYIIKDPLKMLPSSKTTHCFQLAAFVFFFSLIGIILGIASEIYSVLYLGVLLVFLSVFLLFSNFWLDSIFGLKMATPILNLLFGTHYYRVNVQNIYGGNNLIFFIKRNEISRLPNINIYKKDKTNNFSRATIRPRLRANFL